jgi:hypothetical protein
MKLSQVFVNQKKENAYKTLSRDLVINNESNLSGLISVGDIENGEN